jgi:acetylornithine deacetylase/succinyl-diaminopimelate desuccinylase-like protein
LAATTAAILKLKATGFKPSRDIVVFYTGDEETAQIGALKGATEWWKWIDAGFGLNADAGGGSFIKDGSSSRFGIQTAEKTYADYELKVTNPGGHSSRPRKDNAIYELAGALKRLEAHRFEPILSETTRAYFSVREKQEKGPLGDAMRAWLKNPKDDKAAEIIEADPGELGLTRTTCVATRLFGGHADNALPQVATATINCRIFPGISAEATKAELQKIVLDPGVVVTEKGASVASSASPLRKDILDAFSEAVHERFKGAAIIPQMSTGATDAVFFRAKGIPIYGVDGAWRIVPEDSRAHGRDERLPVKALADNVDHWEKMLSILAK